MGLNRNQLEHVLDATIEHMRKLGLLNDKMEINLKNNKENLLDSILELDLTKDDLNDKNVQNKLVGALVSKALDQDELSKNFIKALDPSKVNDPKLDMKAAVGLNILKAVDDAVKEMKANPDKKLTPKELSAVLLNKLKMNLQKDFDVKDAPKLESTLDNMKDPLTDGLRYLFGGDDPRVAGEVQTVVIGPTLGNAMGLTNQTIPDPKSVSYMCEANTFNAGKADPMGIEATLMVNDIADGISSALDSLPRMSPFDTKPKPYG